VCASARTDQSDMSQKVLEKILEKIDPTDLAIMTIGAWLGYHGWTPLTSLINIAKDLPPIPQLDIGLFELGKSPFPFAWQDPIGQLIRLISGGEKPPEEATEEEKKKIHERYLAAGIGFLEAYALTRPGTLGGILQGIGEIAPL